MLKPSYFIGIDPGKNGGLACLSSSGKVLRATVMPSTERVICDWFLGDDLPGYCTGHAFIEKVHSRPSQSAQSGFTFGMGYGGLRMALIAAEIPFEEVTPQAWMKALGIPKRSKSENKTAWKHRLRAKAQQLFPTLEVWEEKVANQLAVADALLIAFYCRRLMR